MRKLWIIPIVLLLAMFTIGYAQQVFVGDIHKIWWAEEVEPSFAIRTYDVCIIDRVGGMPIKVGETDVTPTKIEPFVVDISEYDFEVTFGVRTVWVFTMDVTLDNIQYHVGDRLESVWNYSDVNGEWTPNPFVAWRAVLAPPKGFEHGQ